MFPCEMARYIAGFAPEARKYGRFRPPPAGKLGRRRTNLGRGVRIFAGAPFCCSKGLASIGTFGQDVSLARRVAAAPAKNIENNPMQSSRRSPEPDALS